MLRDLDLLKLYDQGGSAYITLYLVSKNYNLQKVKIEHNVPQRAVVLICK